MAAAGDRQIIFLEIFFDIPLATCHRKPDLFTRLVELLIEGMIFSDKERSAPSYQKKSPLDSASPA